ncbi:hypothetical protein GCM10020295_11910 [Streptomyces cinereospinus]
MNSATNAWWWWTLFGDVGAVADEAFAHIRHAMRALTGRVPARAEADGSTPRAAAHAVAAGGCRCSRSASGRTADAGVAARPRAGPGR